MTALGRLLRRSWVRDFGARDERLVEDICANDVCLVVRMTEDSPSFENGLGVTSGGESVNVNSLKSETPFCVGHAGGLAGAHISAQGMIAALRLIAATLYECEHENIILLSPSDAAFSMTTAVAFLHHVYSRRVMPLVTNETIGYIAESAGISRDDIAPWTSHIVDFCARNDLHLC